MSSQHSDDMDRTIELKNGSNIVIKQKTVGDVGCVVWDAALVLLHYFQTKHFAETFGSLEDQRVVELGSGTGVVGIVAGIQKAQVTITDMEEFISLMEENITRNKQLLDGNVRAQTYKWGSDHRPLGIPPHPRLVVFSDCIYYTEAVQPLVKALQDLCDQSTDVICSYEERTLGANGTSLTNFMELIGKDFEVTEIAFEDMDPVFRSEDIHILHMKKRPK
ncbi:protein N-lysine methyltransferase METTL21D-like [Apostichopus japonicus]|uniref:protein N-lysine methyltransferase METTL21D-like n=1 Tax=Stichopus japonicus TaxID=307972 RepID=UPI003AB1732A